MGQIQKKQIMVARIGAFKPNAQNIKTSRLLKLLHGFQPDFAQQYNHQVVIVRSRRALQQIQDGGRPPFYKSVAVSQKLKNREI